MDTDTKQKTLIETGFKLNEKLRTPSPLHTPEPTFRNIDYTGMKIQEQIKLSARRERVLESGERVPDKSWTEVKLESARKKNQRHISVTPFPAVSELSSPLSRAELNQTEKKLLIKSIVRRSARLAQKKKRETGSLKRLRRARSPHAAKRLQS